MATGEKKPAIMARDIGASITVDCACTYDADANTFNLTKQHPKQITGNNYTVRFTADHDYVAGATFTLDGDTYTTAYDSSPAPVISGAFRKNATITLNFQKFPGGGVIPPV